LIRFELIVKSELKTDNKASLFGERLFIGGNNE